MSMSLHRRSLLIGMTLTVLPALAFGSAPVYGIKSPNRFPGLYYVSFKTSQELAAMSPEQSATSICPGLRPTGPKQAQKLATCLADNLGAINIGMLYLGKREIAVVKGLSDSSVSILANDPRVNSIQASMKVKKAAS